MWLCEKMSLQEVLTHHGIKGQKWGVRRYQNKDGTLTTAGKKRYDTGSDETKKMVQVYQRKFNRLSNKQDQHDELGLEVDAQYKKLGRTKIGRVIAAAKGSSPEAKKYLKACEDWTRKQDLLDAEWEEVGRLYKKTGKTFVSRVLNNIRYNIDS